VGDSVEQEIMRVETKRIDAMVALDLAALDPILADDLTYSHSSGRTDTKASFLELVRSGHYLGVDFVKRDIVAFGNAAIVRGLAQMRVNHDGENLSYPILFLEAYALRGSNWKLVAWQATRAKA
jgi:hypothetical protein